MFENKNLNSSSSSGPGADTQKPPSFNLDDLNKNKDFPFKKTNGSISLAEKKLAGNKGPVEDILAETEGNSVMPQSGESPPSSPETKLNTPPKVPSMQAPSAAPPLTPKPTEELSENPPVPPLSSTYQSKPKNKIFIVIIIIFAIAILGLAGWFAYKYFIASPTSDSNIENTLPENENSSGLDDLLDILNQPQDEEEESEVDIVPDVSTDNEVSPILNQVDSDNDGLTDEEEYNLGTNPNEFDTDKDGLSDFEELEIYATNPILFDTDDDGYNDGEEIQNGYDPLRSGGAKIKF